MRNAALILSITYSLLLLATNMGYCEGDIYYARCNLKVIKGLNITWVNWQSAPTFIPVNTKFKVIKAGDKASLVDVSIGSKYTLDAGTAGDIFLEKFIVKNPVLIEKFPPEIQANIQKAVVGIGMTKEQVYIAMGPPVVVKSDRSKSKTNIMTYEQIMQNNVWVYKKRGTTHWYSWYIYRDGLRKNIGVSFQASTGRVNYIYGN